MKHILQFIAIFYFHNTFLMAQAPPPPPLQTEEVWTGLYSLSCDYQTSGSLRYIVENPDFTPFRSNYCAVIMGQHDSSSVYDASRYIYYSYSNATGDLWEPDVLNSGLSWGYPDISIHNGNPVISAYRSDSGTRIFEDIIFPAYAFIQLPGIPPLINMSHLTGAGNNIILAGTSSINNFTGQYTVYNGTNWSPLISLPLISGSAGNFSVESGTNGTVGIFGINNTGDRYIYFYKSKDNGLTFDNGSLIFKYDIDGTDTLFANTTGGLQASFRGSEPHLVFTVYKISSNVFPGQYTTEFIKPKILHWSPSTGVTPVAGNFNIMNLANTITTVAMAPVGQPSLSVSANGLLICSFTVFLQGNTQVVDDGSVLNAGEIFAIYSENNGVTWGNANNITGTPGIEEKHSSLANHVTSMSFYDKVKIYYLRDMKAGGWVNVPSFGKAPVYGIMKQARIFSIGINQISSNAASFKLSQNYPNPFNPSTTIKFDIPKSEFTTLSVYDINGREIRSIVNEKLNPGSYEYEFSAGDYNLSSGVYIYKLVSGSYSDKKRMILIK